MTSWYDEVISYIRETNPIYETIIYNMGKVNYSRSINTAAVRLNKRTNKISLLVNTDFVSKNTPEGNAAVLAHESTHLLFSHLTEQKYAKKLGYLDSQKLKLAQECIVNDYISSKGFNLPDFENKDGVVTPARETFLFGKERLGFDTLGMSTITVYAKITDEMMDNIRKPETQMFICFDGDLETNGDSDLNEELEKQFIKDALNDPRAKNIEIREFSPDGKKKTTKSFMSTFGSTFDTREANELSEKYGTNIEWLKFLHEINPKFLKKDIGLASKRTSPDWLRRNRHAMGLPSTIIYPARKQVGEDVDKYKKGALKPEIIFFLDCSGSVDEDLQDRMIRLLDTVPQELIDTKIYTFSTYCVPFVKGGEIASGGTSFDAVVNCVEDLNAVRQNVVVITDGMGYVSIQGNFENYSWVMFDRDDTLPGGILEDEVKHVMYLDDVFPNVNS